MMPVGNYAQQPLSDLLECFASGEPGPAAGSAVCITGALAASLVQMVAGLTCSKPAYTEFHPRCAEIGEQATAARKRLLASVDEDARSFARVIEARRARDAAETKSKRQFHAEAANEALRPAVELPLRVARTCLEVAEMAAELLHRGVKSARGDSQVALGLALAAGEGALTAAEYNLRSCPTGEWALAAREAALRLREELGKRRHPPSAATP